MINSILKCDNIIVLSEGEIVEGGTTEDLLKNRESRFAKMFNEINKNLD